MTKPTLLLPTVPTNQVDFGIVIALSAADPFYDFEVEVAPDLSGAPDTGNSTSYAVPGTQPTWTLPTPADNSLRWFRVRHVKGNLYTPSAWLDWQPIRPYPLLQAATTDATALEARRRTDTIYSADGVLQETTQIISATQARQIARGHQVGQGVHGQSVSFSPVFNNVPLVSMRGGISYEPRAKWGTDAAIVAGTASGASNVSTNPQYDELEPLNLTASGFDIRARLRQRGSGTLTQRTATFAANTLDVIGEEAISGALANAPAYDDRYTVRYDVSLTGLASAGSSVTFIVAIDTRPTSVGAWTERATRSYTLTAPTGGVVSQSWIQEELTVVVSGLTSTGNVRVRLKDIQVSGSFDYTGSYAHAHGAGGGETWGVQYYTISAADTYASKTPDATDRVSFEAVEVG